MNFKIKEFGKLEYIKLLFCLGVKVGSSFLGKHRSRARIPGINIWAEGI
jgi:hypothetical protein